MTAESDPGQHDPGESDFVAEVHSTFEPLVIAKVCQPVLERLPERIAPNTISLFNHFVSWAVAALAIASPHLGRVGQPLALVLVSLGMFATMVMDCLDGMQARRTNRCSKLGELMDHWLDAIHVVLVSVGIVMALQLAPWAVAAVVTTTAMVYNAQLVLYHHTGAYVHPPTSGTDAQVGVSAGYLVGAAVFSFASREARWVEIAVTVMPVVAILSQLRLSAFYYRRLGRLLWRHARFLLLCGGWIVAYLTGAIDTLAFCLAITFTSFRITGSYVLRSIVKQPYGGFDWLLALWIALCAASPLLVPYAPWLERPLLELGPLALSPRFLLPYLACAYVGLRNPVEVAVHYQALRPPPSSAG